METTVEMVKFGNIFDAFSMVSLADTTSTISNNLSEAELDKYATAIMKVGKREKLNRQDLSILDKVDEITFAKHGLCLKDSMVTRARIKACKKFGMKFNDRDGLVNHMNMMLGFWGKV